MIERIHDGGIVANETLAAVGPIDPGNGFPRWYEDSKGIRLELGLDPNDERIAALEVPQSGPVIFPGNFPEEAFYFLAEAELTIGGPAGRGRAKLVLGLEATFAGAGKVGEGQQIVFGRTRLRIQNGRPGTEYVFTHPYGSDHGETDDRGKLDITVDIGVSPGQFSEALASGVAPFLRWDSGAPDGYLGDHNIPHTVTGSPDGRNFFRVAGIGVETGSDRPETVETSLFSVQGKRATQIGAQVDRAVRSAPDQVDVFASSAPAQDLAVGGAGVPVTAMRGADRAYVARVGTTADEVVIENRTGGGSSVVTAVEDLVSIEHAAFDLDATPPVLTVRARTAVAGADLEVVGLGPLQVGVDTPFPLEAPPAAIRVRSTRPGREEPTGSATAQVVLSGATDASEPPVARLSVTTVAGVRMRVTPGQELTLDSTGSTGAITSRTWTATAGQIAEPTAARTILTAPQGEGPFSVTLSVTDAGDRSGGDKLDLTVEASQPPHAAPGADRAVDVGEPVVLDADGSAGATTFRWEPIVKGTATIEPPDAVRPTVTVLQGDRVELALTVSGPGGPDDTRRIVLTGRAGSVQIDRAEYRADKKQWRVSGSASGPDAARRRPDRVTVSTPLGEIGSAPVDAAGAWSVDAGLVGPPPLEGDPVTVRSSRGGVAESPLTVRR